IINTENEHVLGFMRTYKGKQVIVLANFSESPQVISLKLIQDKKVLHGNGKETIEALGIMLYS
ncbi:MAG: alpha-glucosidase C-terminal domain-containing protein, partial [Anaerolineales bacterium]